MPKVVEAGWGEQDLRGWQSLTGMAPSTGNVRLVVVADEAAHQLRDRSRVKLLAVKSREHVVVPVNPGHPQPNPLLILMPAVLEQHRDGVR
ncbi:MAG: hypothetical protein ABJB49_08970, partial [Nitrospirota bacterium]